MATEDPMCPAGYPGGQPLTHFFHCWRFPDHHPCAVALIERMASEQDQVTGQAAALERKLRDVTAAVPDSVTYAAGQLADHYLGCPATSGPDRIKARMIQGWLRDIRQHPRTGP